MRVPKYAMRCVVINYKKNINFINFGINFINFSFSRQFLAKIDLPGKHHSKKALQNYLNLPKCFIFRNVNGL